MNAATKFGLLAIALAMGCFAWYNLTRTHSVVQGSPCIAQQGVRTTADGVTVACTQDVGWKPVR